MRKIICFKLHPKADLEESWQELDAAGYVLLYSSEETSGQKEIFAEHAHAIEGLLERFSFLKEVSEGELPEIDWDAQWECHGADFKDGYVHVDLKEFGSPTVIKLKPGPGFGDLSHPTTLLVLEMMPLYVKGKCVVDVGSGSGVLSFAAEAMGAHSVHGIDIDPAAVQHARANAEVNASQATFGLPGEKSFNNGDLIILMNMIQNEQKEAWKDLQLPAGKQCTVITSGILKEGRSEYLNQARKWGLHLQEEKERDGWCGFLFQHT